MRFFILHIVMFLSCTATAQHLNGDVLTVEALIADHNRISSILLTRSAIEELNGILHEASSVTSVEYKDVNTELDKYTRCFNVIDDIVNSGATAFHFYRTYDILKERVQSYLNLLKRYKEQCLEHGDYLSTDSIIFTTSRDGVKELEVECKELLKDMSNLVKYVTGVSPCTHENMMDILKKLNDDLDYIVTTIDHAYFRLWKYVMLRTGYHKASVLRGKTLKQMADEALDRWMRSAHGIDY